MSSSSSATRSAASRSSQSANRWWSSERSWWVRLPYATSWMRTWRKRNAVDGGVGPRTGVTSSLASRAWRCRSTNGMAWGATSAVTAAAEKSSPMTDAQRSRSCSAGPSRSRRAVSSACTVGGMRSLRSSRSAASNCSRNSGLPWAVSTTRVTASDGSARPKRRLVSRRSLSPGSSGASGTVTAASSSCAQLVRRPRNSGRARHSSTSGWCVEAARFSSRSRSVGWAQWRSSMMITSGFRRATASNSRRTAPNSVLGSAGWSTIPTALATSAAVEKGSGSSVSSSVRPSSRELLVSSRRISRSGQNVIPSPYGGQGPVTTRAAGSTLVANSLAKRDLPTPASPMTVTSVARPSWTDRSKAPRSRSSSSRRPT